MLPPFAKLPAGPGLRALNLPLRKGAPDGLVRAVRRVSRGVLCFVCLVELIGAFLNQANRAQSFRCESGTAFHDRHLPSVADFQHARGARKFPAPRDAPVSTLPRLPSSWRP